MINIVFIGVVTALAVFTILAKACAREHKRPEKQEKAEIVKQLLALSERQNSLSATVPPIRSGVPFFDRDMRPGKFHHKPTGKISEPLRSNK